MKKVIWMSVITLIIIVIFVLIIKNNSNVATEYARICNGSGEIVECIILYESNKQYSYSFFTSNTESYGSTNWITSESKRKKLKHPSDVMSIVRDNGPSSYVLLNVDVKDQFLKEYHKGDILTIEEFDNLISVETDFDDSNKK